MTYHRSRGKIHYETEDTFHERCISVQEEQERGARKTSLPDVIYLCAERDDVVVEEDCYVDLQKPCQSPYSMRAHLRLQYCNTQRPACMIILSAGFQPRKSETHSEDSSENGGRGLLPLLMFPSNSSGDLWATADGKWRSTHSR